MPGDPAKDFTATDLTIYDSGAAFTTAVAEQSDRVLVFVHGYNTGFDDGVYRVTQIAQDTRYPGTPMLFSWASGAGRATMSTTRTAAPPPATTWKPRSSCCPKLRA